MNNILTWIEQWYLSQCDGEWEHEYGVKIYTVDNPGWYIIINLALTNLEHAIVEEMSYEKDENDWYFYFVKDGYYKAGGDPQKLELLLTKFKEIAENVAK